MKRGYTYKRGPVWAVAIPDSYQRSGYKHKSGFLTKGQASEYLSQRRNIIGKLQTNQPIKGEVAYKSFFREYLNHVEKSFSYETIKTYKGVLKNFLKFSDERYPHMQYLYDLRAKVFEDYKIWLKDTKHKDLESRIQCGY